jgi:hypothetical protein
LSGRSVAAFITATFTTIRAIFLAVVTDKFWCFRKEVQFSHRQDSDDFVVNIIRKNPRFSGIYTGLESVGVMRSEKVLESSGRILLSRL